MQANAPTVREALRKRILMTGPPMKVAKKNPKGFSKHFRGRLRRFQNALKTLPRCVFEVPISFQKTPKTIKTDFETVSREGRRRA